MNLNWTRAAPHRICAGNADCTAAFVFQNQGPGNVELRIGGSGGPKIEPTLTEGDGIVLSATIEIWAVNDRPTKVVIEV